VSVKLRPSLSCFLLFLSILPLYATPGDLLWRFKTDSSFYAASPFVSNGIVYFGNYGQVFYALNSRDGSEIWSKEGLGVMYTRPFVDKERVFFSTYSTQGGYLRSHNAYNGEEIWKYYWKEGGYSPYATADIVYWGTDDGVFIALNASNASLKWKYQTNGAIYTIPCTDNIKGTVFFGNIRRDYSLFALDLLSGQKKWSYKTGGYLRNPCMSASGEVVFTSSSATTYGDVFALNASSGEMIWSMDFNRSVTSPCIGNGKIYFCCRNFYFYALDEETGNTEWSYGIGSDSNPCYRDSIVYI